jgi:hypothetical protein
MMRSNCGAEMTVLNVGRFTGSGVGHVPECPTGFCGKGGAKCNKKPDDESGFSLFLRSDRMFADTARNLNTREGERAMTGKVRMYIGTRKTDIPRRADGTD